jgi:N6-adenosine-specific RNA methylase IME4
MIEEHHKGRFDIVYADPAWTYYGSQTKNGAAGKHYKTSMTPEQINALPVKSLFRDPKHGAAFVWATCPLLPLAIDAGRAWGLHYRGVAFNWVKTRKDGGVIGAQGVPPTATKPTSELCLLFTTCKKGRPFKLMSSKVPQVVLAPRGAHSEKPALVRDRIVEVYGDRPRIELFSRHQVDGWERIGDQLL